MHFLFIETLEIFSAISFLIYGSLSFVSKRMKDEFKRWGISKFRLIVGVSQFLGGFGLILGFYFPFLTIISSLGLTILMLLGFVLRIYVRDGFLKSFPALLYLLINLFIFLNLK
tara:strand:- start:927 stop:1268 length:342 start_codon:yes stop_codon:yes gene_type:complete